MPIAKGSDVLNYAHAHKFAVPAFNVCNLELLQAVVTAADNARAPILIAIHPVELEYGGLDELAWLARNLAGKTSVPIVLHLDHGDSLERVRACIEAGFTSVMFDGSELPIEENEARTKEVVEVAHAAGVSVEGEVGMLGGGEGQEYVEIDTVSADDMTDPAVAETFAKNTGVDTLAVAVGNAHGMYRGKPNIDVKRIREIQGRVPIPLVLHGGSSTPEDTIRECIGAGVAKINIASELKLALRNGIRDAFASNEESYEPRIFLKRGRKSAVALAEKKIRLFGAAGMG